MEKLRTAAVGFGKMGILHGAIARATGLAEIVAIVEKNPKIRKAVNRAFREQIVVGTDITELRDLSLDVVYVTTPIPSHFEIGIEAIEAGGRGIFFEKTLSDAATKSRILAEKASGKGVTIGVGYHMRFAPTFQYLKRLMEDGTLGITEQVHAFAYSEDFLGYEQLEKSIGRSRGGVLRDLGSHAIGLALWILDCKKPRVVDVRNAMCQPSHEVTFGFLADSIEVTVATSWSKPGYRIPEIAVEVCGSEGKASASGEEVIVRKGSEEKRIRHLELAEQVPYLLASPEYFWENESFLAGVRTGKFKGADARDAAVVDETIDEVLRVHATSGGR